MEHVAVIGFVIECHSRIALGNFTLKTLLIYTPHEIVMRLHGCGVNYVIIPTPEMDWSKVSAILSPVVENFKRRKGANGASPTHLLAIIVPAQVVLLICLKRRPTP